MTSGKVYIASMNLRGEWAKKPHVDCVTLNVTSAQQKKSKNRIDFSPMTEIPGGYKKYFNFESRWQSLKVFEDIPHSITKRWWLNNKAAKRRYPKSKGKKVLYAIDDEIDGKMDYVESRKKVYVPEYYELVKDREQVAYYKDLLSKGKDIVIYDFDGPRKSDGGVDCLEMTLDLLREKINYTKHPFGHGFVVGSLILGIKPEEYIHFLREPRFP